MSATGEIIRLAARGEGVTADGRFVPMTAPGDRVDAAGAITPGPHHLAPPCRHFPECGGCQLQHVDDSAYADYLKDRIAAALAAQGVAAPEFLAPHLSPPRSRRRAALKAAGGSIGFNAEASHRIVDMRECHCVRNCSLCRVPLRRLLQRPRYGHRDPGRPGRGPADRGLAADTRRESRAMTAFATENSLARLALDDGFGPADALGRSRSPFR